LILLKKIDLSTDDRTLYLLLLSLNNEIRKKKTANPKEKNTFVNHREACVHKCKEAFGKRCFDHGNQVRFTVCKNRFTAHLSPMSVSFPGRPTATPSSTFEIKSAQLALVALILKNDAWDALQTELQQQYGPQGESPDFFDNDALVIDFSQLGADASLQDLRPLLAVLRACRLVPVALRGGAHWTETAHSHGLVLAPAEVHRGKQNTPTSVVQEVVKEVVREIPGPATMVVDKPLRSGQKVYARGGDLVVLAMVNQGAEVVADGNIHVYAPLRGKAMAGARGNVNARIFSLCLEPELISIAGVYRTSENPLPLEVRGKAAQVRLSNDGQDKLLIEALKS
jgi:septum site-determining protein MinC